ncbi:hypothetical protein AXA44_36680 [Rhodococcus sp. SC4]|nr:hypothetical protein AXA44_36680 [Rhodococcus sp. SC4]
MCIVVVGDEVLDGSVRDSNGPWLAERIAGTGYELQRIVIVPDVVETIAAEIKRIVQVDKPSLLITTGGVGATWDDVTYEAIARALGVGLVIDESLAVSVRQVVDWTVGVGFALDDASIAGMMRIATVPEGATVHTVTSWLACVQVDIADDEDASIGTTLIALPGPPGHVKTLFDEVVHPTVMRNSTSTSTVCEVEHQFPETVLVGELGKIGAHYPTVKMGSYPGKPMIVRFRGPKGETEAAAADLRRELDRLAGHPAADAIRAGWQSQGTSWKRAES